MTDAASNQFQAVIADRVERTMNDVADIKRKMEESYVTNDQFDNLAKRVDRMEKGALLFMTTVVFAVLGAVLKGVHL